MTDNRTRISAIGIVFGCLAALIILRLGYLQIWRHEHFAVLASQTHMRKFEIAPERGDIFLQDRGKVVAAALNRNLKTLYADTRYIFDRPAVLAALEQVAGTDYTKQLEAADGYVVLEREVELKQASKIEELELSGIGLSDNYVRVYPEGELAAPVLGFVNADGTGQYGVEGFLDDVLAGRAGRFNVATDVLGVPLATRDNIQIEPVAGNDVVLTIDRNLQAYVEGALARGVQATGAESAHAVIMDPDSGRILAMGNYPSFDPNRYSEVSDYSRFVNAAALERFEPGSGFKVFTMAAGLELGAVTPAETFYDAGSVRIGDRTISNAEGGGGAMRSMSDVITNSINTGVIYVLEQLGGGAINDQAKQNLYDFFTKRFMLNAPTGLAQPGEPELFMYTPDEVGVVEYANMTFGQGITTTMVRMLGSMAAAINGGTLYEPQLIDYQIASGGKIIDTKPQVLQTGVVSEATSAQLRAMMETVVERGGGYGTRIDGHRIGGKTGTAQIPNPEGGYFMHRDIGTFTGFAPLDKPQYLMMVRVDEPQVPGYAGSAAAGPIFGDIMQWLLKYGGVAPDA